MATGLVQQDSLLTTNASFTSVHTLNGCVSGNSIIIPFYHANNSNNGTTISASDGVNTYLLDKRIDRVSTYTAGIFRFTGIPAGTNVITLTASNGTAANSFWRSVAGEYSGITGVTDATGSAQNGSSTGPVQCTTTSNLAQNIELAVCAGIAESGSASLITPLGYTNLGLGSTLSASYQVTSAAQGNTLSANCGTLSAAAGWDIVLVTYLTPVLAPPSSGAIFVCP